MIENKKLKKFFVYLVGIVIFTAGFIIAIYPTVSDLYGKYRDSRMVAVYDEIIAKLPEDRKEQLLQEAVSYNNSLAAKTDYLVSSLQFKDEEYVSEAEIERYNNMLKDSSSKIMGTISIPKIAVTLPIYHWSTDDVLDKGIGHIHGSSLPIGNGVDPEDETFANIAGSHSLLIGHRGLPSLKLFSDLDELGIGDQFYVKILGKIYAYKIYDVETVEPDDVDGLRIEPGRDLCTLITCTPYGINTHRILVKGERVPYEGESIEASTSKKVLYSIDPKTVLGLGFIAFIIFMSVYNKKKKSKRKAKGEIEHETISSDAT